MNQDDQDRCEQLQDHKDEDDGFWDIALRLDPCEGGFHDHRNEQEESSDDDDDKDALGGIKPTKYRLPVATKPSIVVLELSPLAKEDGVWAPVGADAWYASALLTSMILMGIPKSENSTTDGTLPENDDLQRTGNHKRTIQHQPMITLDSSDNQSNSTRVLELGSGAMGLSGLATAVALSLQPERYPSSWTVTLTDNDPKVLQQLQANVSANRCNILNLTADGGNPNENNNNSNKTINVEYLDWAEKEIEDNEDDMSSLLLTADLVIGSELAYTHQTGTALVKVLLRLLDKNPKVHIWIVQVRDRYGWCEIVERELESKPGIELHSIIPLPWDIHEMASTLIPMGGTLDRHAFGAFHIFRSDQQGPPFGL
mmetsp:Transcript_23403/g.43464  ORF Transcript_23403/g.43464 Transcript_23403/m.43464 type:complete len:370 (+) Transcript_23403:206-1315(+)